MEKTKLPDYVVNSQAVENRLQEINSTIESANFHLQTLKAEGIPTDLNTLKDILKDEDSFNKWLSKAEESYIGKIGFLPKEEKKRIHSTFSALLSRTDSARNIIHGLLFNRHGYNVLQDKEGNFYFDIEEICKQDNKNSIVAPYLVMGGTDACYYEPICENIYRYAPYKVSVGLLRCTHGTNERIPVEAVAPAVAFFKRYIRKASAE
jgi:acetylornithine deacetylase/succinyl-diaminopimelate desuccinylase-like protein